MSDKGEWLEFNADVITSVPEVDGVYELSDAEGSVIFIAGTPNLRQDLELRLNSDEPCLSVARYFRYEETFMYTQRESELLQRFIRKNKRLPPCNEEVI